MDLKVVVVGGGLAGMAAAWGLVRGGVRSVTIVERGAELGGLAGTISAGGHFYPLAYHHILPRDHALLYTLDQLGVLERVRWRRIRMLFHLDDRLHAMGGPLGFARFPLPAADKLRFAALMLRCFRKSDWSDWRGRTVEELVDAWAGPNVRRVVFERLCQIKFGLPCREVSAAWLGARLNYREGSTPLGFIPGENWTKALCDGLSARLGAAGVRVLLDQPALRIEHASGRATGVALEGGTTLPADVVVSTVPTTVHRRLAPDDATPELAPIRYTAILSALVVTRQRVDPDFYWLNLISGRTQASGLFRLEALNPTIGGPDEVCLNFVNHVPHQDEPLFRASDADLLAGYARDFEEIFGVPLVPAWTRVIRLAQYSPVFVAGFRNPPPRSATWSNLYFAGNFRTFPSIASTGTALGSGLEIAATILAERGAAFDPAAPARSFRVRRMPRG